MMVSDVRATIGNHPKIRFLQMGFKKDSQIHVVCCRPIGLGPCLSRGYSAELCSWRASFVVLSALWAVMAAYAGLNMVAGLGATCGFHICWISPSTVMAQ